MQHIDISPRSGCPIATTLDLVGDKWSLVIVRDMINGKSKFSEFLESPERITTNVLTDRLRVMEETGLIKKTHYSRRPPRFEYCLTDKGRSMHPILQEVCRWANHYIPETWEPPDSFMQPSS